MRMMKDCFLVSARSADAYRLKGTSLDLYVDPDFQKGHTHCTVVSGTIIYLPMSISPRKKDDRGEGLYTGFYNHTSLYHGEKIYFHHFCVSPDNRYDLPDGRECYLVHMRDIYAVIRDGEVVPLEDWCFGEALFEDESRYTRKVGDIVLFTRPYADRIRGHLKLKYVSPVVREAGLSEGAVVQHICGMNKDADYDMMIEGSLLYRISLRDIDIVNI